MSEARANLGDYELLARLGRGRNCEVFLALRRGGGREKIVAIKQLREGGKADSASLLAEAELVARIEHPRVVDVYEYGEADGDCYIAMEYLAGRPLGSLIKRHGALPATCVAQIGADIADGLHAVHQVRSDDHAPLGLVHLDVSPSNIQILYDGRAMLLDFGLARAAEDATARGKIGYLAPEQVRRERADARTDVFALGIVLWEAMTGRRLFRRGSRAETLRAITGEPAPPPSARGAPGDLDEILARALAVDREDRFANAADLAVVLRERIPEDSDPQTELAALMLEHFEAERAAAESLIDETLGGGAQTEVSDDDDWDAAAHLEATQPRWGRRAAIGGGVLAAIALIAGIVFGLWSSGEPTGEPGESSAAKATDGHQRQPDHTTAREAYSAASRLLVTGDTNGAIEKYREALEAWPDYAPALRGLGLAHERRGDNSRALRYYRRYLRASPNARDADSIRERIARLGG